MKAAEFLRLELDNAMPHQPDAPRFTAYCERAGGRPVLRMPSSDWAAISGQSTDAVLIDITKTPMGCVASDATVVAAYAQRFSTATAEVAIVRLDPSDAPNVYNIDKYLVWEDLPSHHNFSQIIQAASTEDNQNLRDYLKRNVFIVKLEPDAEHHRPEMPTTVRLLLQGRST